MMEYLIPILIILVLVALNGVFVAAEFAIVGARASRVQMALEQGSGPARYILKTIKSATGKDQFIAVCQLGITLASIGLGMYGEKTIASWLYKPLEVYGGLGYAASHTVGTIISLSLITYMHVVFGEMIPKALALQAPEQTSFGVATPIRVFGFVFRPLVWVLNTMAFGLLRLLRIKDEGSGERLYTSDELEYLVQETAESGQLDAERQHIIENIFEFGERQVHEVMTPRTRVEALSIRASKQDIERKLLSGEHSRYPVMDRNLDQLLGYLHIKDIIRHPGGQLNVSTLLRTLPSIPETMHLTDALEVLKKRHAHMAVVLDEFGGTSGILTLSDLVGDILTERPSQIQQIDEDTAIVSGTVLLSELESITDHEIQDTEAATVGGWVIEELGRPAQVGDAVTLPHHKLEVLAVDGVQVQRVKVSRVLPA